MPGHGLFYVGILAGLYRVEEDRDVPEVRGRDNDPVHATLLQQILVVAERLGTLSEELFGHLRSAIQVHRPEGLLVAMGCGLKPGRIEQTISIMDLAPTISSLLGVRLPEVDGKPITRIINDINLQL